MWFILPVLLGMHVLVCGLLILVVLLQRPRSEGLGAAFGGTVTDNLFGAQTTSVLGKATVWLGVGFFALTLLLAIAYARRDSGETAVQRQLLSQPVPTATATPVPVADADPRPAEPSSIPEASPAASPVE